MTARRRKGGGGRTLGGLFLVLLGALLGAGAFWLLSGCPGRRAADSVPPSAATPPPSPTRSPAPPPAPTPSRQAPPPSDFESSGEPGRGVVAVVLDDVGYPGRPLAEIALLEGPVALAVLPDSPGAPEAAELARRKGWDLLVHLPMEPAKGKGEPGAIGPGQSDAEVAALVRGAVARLPGAIGVNNHQGSRASADRRVMAAVLGVVGEKGLFFLDSRTTAATVVPETARRLRVPFLARDVFLDDRATEEKAEGGPPEALATAWERAKGIARRRGQCIVIGHPHPATLAFLQGELPRLGGEGLKLVKVSDLVE